MNLCALFLAALVAATAADWPTYGYDLANSRHVPLVQINEANVASIVPVWRFQTDAAGPMESSPIVVDGAMYVTTADRDGVIDLDAATGVVRWQYWPTLGHFFFCCAKVNRGVAVADGLVFVATLDGRLIALDAATGAHRWDVSVGDTREGFSETGAPLAWNGMVFVGSAGAEFGIRGSYSVYRAADGKLLWRWWATNPGWEGAYVTTVHGYSLHRDITAEKADATRYRDAWRHGGGTVWMTPALDPARGMLYISTGNPSPDFNARTRPGDNLYTDSIVALDARTGRMRWYYQETPHDMWDFDAASPPFLMDALDRSGRRVAAVGEAGKTGWVYVLDRDSGAELRISENLVPSRRVYPPQSPAIINPGGPGGALGPVSYDPSLRLAFVAATDRPDEWRSEPTPLRTRGVKWMAGSMRPLRYSLNSLVAVSSDSGRIVWRRHLSGGPGERFNLGFISGSLSAGDLVFVGEPNGVFFALDARDGSVLWRYDLNIHGAEIAQPEPSAWQRLSDFIHGLFHPAPNPAPPAAVTARIDAPPIRYVVNGREYIALCVDVSAGDVERNVVMAFALSR
jgi:alcohol dehydrogenase (cytochrome c)